MSFPPKFVYLLWKSYPMTVHVISNDPISVWWEVIPSRSLPSPFLNKKHEASPKIRHCDMIRRWNGSFEVKRCAKCCWNLAIPREKGNLTMAQKEPKQMVDTTKRKSISKQLAVTVSTVQTCDAKGQGVSWHAFLASFNLSKTTRFFVYWVWRASVPSIWCGKTQKVKLHDSGIHWLSGCSANKLEKHVS